MVPPRDLSGKESIYAIWTNYEKFPISSDAGGNQYYFMIIDHEGMLDGMTEIRDSWNSSTESEEEYDEMDVYDKAELYRDVVYEHIVAMLRVKDDVDGGGACNGAWEVERSAATEGLGPTLYDMVMSISPGGLVSDRNSVSDAAFKYWKISANHRGDIDKKFLDTLDNKYTVYPIDNCTLYDDPSGARGTHPENLIKYASRQLAIEFLNLEHDEIHNHVINTIATSEVIRLGNVGGDAYVELVITHIDELISNGTIDLSTFKFLTFDDPSDIQVEWEQYKIENEHDMFDNFVEDDLESRSSILNLSYNTDYAVNDFKKMVNKFDDFEVEARGMLDEVYTLLFIDEMRDFAGRFFDEKYYK